MIEYEIKCLIEPIIESNHADYHNDQGENSSAVSHNLANKKTNSSPNITIEQTISIIKQRLADIGAMYVDTQSMINIYYSYSDLAKALHSFRKHFEESEWDQIRTLAQSQADSVSIRVREVNSTVVSLIVKASLNSQSHHNGNHRIEIEVFPKVSCAELDEALLANGAVHLSKWSRVRETYSLGDITICIDKNSGYGYIVEIEIASPDIDEKEAQHKTSAVAHQLNITELDPLRLERMFEYYNQNWQEYFGTEKTFVIK